MSELALKPSILLMMFITLMSSFFMQVCVTLKMESSGNFPEDSIFLSFIFMVLMALNLISLVSFSYPVTTTLTFNLAMALTLWSFSNMLLLTKINFFSTLLPVNSPSYLVPFLGVVELTSVLVRPLTLCFRLLANMSAGHILLSLMCKLSFGVWTIGVSFGLLELMVAVVQAFVFILLTKVYLEEVLTH